MPLKKKELNKLLRKKSLIAAALKRSKIKESSDDEVSHEVSLPGGSLAKGSLSPSPSWFPPPSTPLTSLPGVGVSRPSTSKADRHNNQAYLYLKTKALHYSCHHQSCHHQNCHHQLMKQPSLALILGKI